MKLIIKIKCDNAAFGDSLEDAAQEVARILRDLADRYERVGVQQKVPLMDYNGNQVGYAEVAE